MTATDKQPATKDLFTKFISSLKKKSAADSESENCSYPRLPSTNPSSTAIASPSGPLSTAYALPTSNPPELGLVHFHTPLSSALALDKLIYIQFQEIPGCGTCTRFGAEVLAHPLIVELIETLTTPVAVRNNTQSEPDISIMRRYGEPAWNNPVARLVSPRTGADVAQRLSDIYAPRDVMAWLLSSLSTAVALPAWVDIAAASVGLALVRLPSGVVTDIRTVEPEVIVCEMGCYWEGERVLGGLTGVLRTWPGWCEGREVVEVTYDPKVITVGEIRDAAARNNFTVKRGSGPWKITPVGYGEVKYHLKSRGGILRYLPLTQMQQARINSAIGSGRGAEASWLLTPRQAEMARRMAEAADADAFQQLRPPYRDEELAGYMGRFMEIYGRI
ncbi:hypothetical protein HK101_011414 [Irineochytrium annulatum]|nr:hypothetical protein HK101_011414 [Irineochytrium annulatum]